MSFLKTENLESNFKEHLRKVSAEAWWVDPELWIVNR